MSSSLSKPKQNETEKEALSLAVPLIAKFEGWKPKPYKDIVGITTVGFGFTDFKVLSKYADGMTKEEGYKILKEEVERIQVNLRNSFIAVGKKDEYDKLTSNKLAALYSLIYNIGLTKFKSYRVWRALILGDYQGAVESMLSINKAGGKVIKGLVNRRNAEVELFNKA